MPVKFMCVYSTPLKFFYLLTSTNISQNTSNRKMKRIHNTAWCCIFVRPCVESVVVLQW